jgi:hypothetical protein
MTFTLTYPEFKQAWKAYVRYRTGRRDWVSPLVFGFMIAGLIGMAMYVGGVFGSRRPATVTDWVLLMMVAAYLAWRVVGFTDGQYRALWRKMDFLGREQTVTIDGDHLRFQQGTELRTVELRSYQAAIDTPDTIVLVAQTGGDLIPKRALDAVTIDRLLSISRKTG